MSHLDQSLASLSLAPSLNRFAGVLALVALPLAASAATRVISPAYSDRYLPITEVTYLINGNPVTQTSEAVSVSQQSQPVFVTGVKTATRTLDIFNFAGAQIRDANGVLGQSSIQVAQSGIGIVDHTGLTPVSAGKAAFDSRLAASTQNNNILEYIYYDGSNTTPAAAFDFDLLFVRAFESTDAFLIQERNGNTHFKVNALGADGNVIAGSNTLVFGGNTDENPEVNGDILTRYDWNTGYALSNYQSTQPIALTVVEVSQIFTGTEIAEQDQVVYGFRIDNNGNADVKFFGLSDDSFDNNPLNPLIIPEPASTGALAAFFALGFAGFLRRRR